MVVRIGCGSRFSNDAASGNDGSGDLWLERSRRFERLEMFLWSRRRERSHDARDMTTRTEFTSSSSSGRP
jgi:hypothetical protein